MLRINDQMNRWVDTDADADADANAGADADADALSFITSHAVWS